VAAGFERERRDGSDDNGSRRVDRRDVIAR
jgi:hypothetical protein